MASIDDELLLDEEENRREMSFIREQLPAEIKEHFSDEQLQYIMEGICTYLYESHILEANADEVDVDLEEVAAYVCRQAASEGLEPLDPQEVFFVVQADFDYQEANC